MRDPWRYLDAHVLLAGPVSLLEELERDHPIRCVLTKRTPHEVFVTHRTSRTTRWEAVRVPQAPLSPRRVVFRSFVVEDPGLAPRAFLRLLSRVRSPLSEPVVGSLDYEVRGQQEGVHGSPTPQTALTLPGCTEAEYRHQVAFDRIGLLRAERLRHRPQGEGVTVVILDAAPDLRAGTPPFDPELVDVYAEWPHLLPSDLSALVPLEEPEEECAVPELLRTRYRVASPFAVDEDGMRTYRACHGLMVSALVRRIAPLANIVLVRLLNADLRQLTGDLIEAMRWVDSLRAVRHPRTGRPLVYGSVVYNLSLGVGRSQPETVQACVLLWAVDLLARSGAVFVCAAGNLSAGRPENCLEPAAYGQYGDTLAARHLVIPVAAASYAAPERYAWFSNEAHFAAPGEDLILDCGMAVRGSRYVRWSGTSFAAALVTGIVALHLSAGLLPYEVKQRLWEDARHPRLWDGVHLVQVP